MNAELLITGISQLVTAQGAAARYGAAMRELNIVEDAALACNDGKILWTGKASEWTGEATTIFDAGNRAVVPGLIDPHTHAVWAGDRLADFDARTAGTSYESILMSGGGIRSTIGATSAASRDELVLLAVPHIEALVQSGATTIEVKSGYGLTPAGEIAMLETIRSLAKRTKARIVPTLLIHLPPLEAHNRLAYIDQVCTELIPEVSRRQLAAAADVFVEKEAWHVEEAERILESARDHGFATKLHSDQFHSIGGVELGVRMGAISVDHLETIRPEQMETLAASSTIATILPGVSLHLGINGAPGRALIDAGAAVAVGSDLNPGSSPLFSFSLALALAVRLNGLTTREALIAGTVNSACALGLRDCGRLEAGACADFLVLHSHDWRDLLYLIGKNPVKEVWIGGKRVSG